MKSSNNLLLKKKGLNFRNFKYTKAMNTDIFYKMLEN